MALSKRVKKMSPRWNFQFWIKSCPPFAICTPPAAPPWQWAVCLFSGSSQRSHDRAGSGRPFTVNRKQGVKREVFSKIFDVENLEMLRIFRRLGQPRKGGKHKTCSFSGAGFLKL